MPDWINQGYDSYAKRLGKDCRLQLHELPSARKSNRQAVSQVVREDGQKLLACVPAGSHVIALEETGKVHSSAALAKRLQQWQEQYSSVSLLIGGADGLSADCKGKAAEKWSLSALTFPHALVRVIVAEQLYRAHSLLNNHPYHRA